MSAQKSETKLYQEILTKYLRASFGYVERERASMQYALKKLERATREQLERAYGEDLAWRGLATDQFLIMVDTMDAYEKLFQIEKGAK